MGQSVGKPIVRILPLTDKTFTFTLAWGVIREDGAVRYHTTSEELCNPKFTPILTARVVRVAERAYNPLYCILHCNTDNPLIRQAPKHVPRLTDYTEGVYDPSTYRRPLAGEERQVVDDIAEWLTLNPDTIRNLVPGITVQFAKVYIAPPLPTRNIVFKGVIK